VPWVTDERRRDTDFVEQVRLQVSSIEGLADLAQVVIETVRAAVTDSADRYDLTVVARHAAMHIRFPLRCVLRTPSATISRGKAGGSTEGWYLGNSVE